MTHFRFRYKRVGYMRWRCRAAQRRTTLLLLPLQAKPTAAPHVAAWRRTIPLPTPIVPISTVLQVGDYVVGAQGDPQLIGHPDIRY